MLLAFDTAFDRCSIALKLVDGTVYGKTRVMQRGQAEALIPMIDALFNEHALQPNMLRRIAVVTGPGSFAGVRVAVAAARGLSLSLGIKALGFSAFETLLHVAKSKTLTGPVLTLIAASPNRFFAQGFDAQGQALEAPQIVQPDRLQEQLEAWKGQTVLYGKVSADVQRKATHLCLAPDNLAQPLVELADAAEIDTDAHLAVPLYMRPPDAKRPASMGLRKLSEE